MVLTDRWAVIGSSASRNGEVDYSLPWDEATDVLAAVAQGGAVGRRRWSATQHAFIVEARLRAPAAAAQATSEPPPAMAVPALPVGSWGGSARVVRLPPARRVAGPTYFPYAGEPAAW